MLAEHSYLALWLKFFSSWPIAFLVALWMFRSPLKLLLERVLSFKWGDAAFAFQQPASDAKEKTPVKPADVMRTDFSTSLSEEGVREVVRASGLIGPGDEVLRTLRMFWTSRQSTWLTFTKDKVFCVLDDENTRKSGRLVQWVLGKDLATPVHARVSSGNVGLVDIGLRTNWLYSTRLFPTPDALEREIASALEASV